MPKVYTLGYAQAGSQQRLEEMMGEPNMILVDTRMSPRTRYVSWSGVELQARWGAQYRWGGRYLGNKNYQGGPIQLADPVTGIDKVIGYLQNGYNVILLCGCKNYDACHRHVIVDLLRTDRPDVEIVPETSVASLKCFSIRPPYAQWIVQRKRFIAAGLSPKTIENREWTTQYRGPLLIHASKKFEEDAPDYWTQRVPGLGKAISLSEADYEKGMIIGIADLVNVVEQSSDPWFVGTYGWVFANARPLRKPIAYRGQLKFWDVPRSVVADVLPEPLTEDPIQSLRDWFEEDQVLSTYVKNGIPVSVGQQSLERKRRYGEEENITSI